MITTTERLIGVKWVDSQAVKAWRPKARIMAMSALQLANNPDYTVFVVRNSKGTLLGLAACYKGVKGVILAHLATRDAGQGVGSMLINEVMANANGLPVKTTPEPGAESFYAKLGWRKVGVEYWSK